MLVPLTELGVDELRLEFWGQLDTQLIPVAKDGTAARQAVQNGAIARVLRQS